MNLEFNKHRQLLLSAFRTTTLNGSSKSYTNFTLFIKGDVSGIQDFIFSIKSDGASKALKGRSHFIEAATAIVVKKIETEYKLDFELLYNGGGNFYCLMKNVTLEQISLIQSQFDVDLMGQDFYFSLTAIEVSADDFNNFGHKWKALHAKAAEDKLKRFKNHPAKQLFDPYPKNEKPLFARNSLEKFKDRKKEDVLKDLEVGKIFTEDLVKSNGIIIEKISSNTPNLSYIDLFGYRYVLSESDQSFKGKITNVLPKNEDERITDFDKLAEFAYARTGSKKLAVLKFDVDNLGATFQNIKDITKTKALSDALKWFFESHLLDLLKENNNYYLKNLYVVFSGGDDGFIVGAWDAVFEFTKLLSDKFNEFVKSENAENAENEFKMTLSAALLLIDPHFPVVRFADLAEDELKKAKNAKKTKSTIAIFGEILTWQDFKEAQTVALKLKDYIEKKDVSRTILDRIKRSRIGFEKLQNRAFTEGVLRGQALWRLQYYLRSSKNKGALEKDIIEPYQRALLLAALDPNKEEKLKEAPLNPAIFPVAARWAEFLTRK